MNRTNVIDIKARMTGRGNAAQAALYKDITGSELVDEPTATDKRSYALNASHIQRITTEQLDEMLAPLMRHGLVTTTYERTTGATEYRMPSGRVFAVTIGTHHFATHSPDIAASFRLYTQSIGRIKRTTDADRLQ